RRRFNTSRPFFVLIRTRNPCARLRRRVFGWNVRLPFIRSSKDHRLQVYEPAIVANGFQQCQCERYGSSRLCAKVALFRAPRHPKISGPSSCTFGLSPEFSTPVEKTVEIPYETMIALAI